MTKVHRGAKVWIHSRSHQHYTEMGGQLHSLITLTLAKKTICSYWRGSCAGRRTGVDVLDKRQSFAPVWEYKFLSCSLQPSHYIDWAILTGCVDCLCCVNQIHVFHKHSRHSTYQNPPTSPCIGSHKSNFPTAMSVSRNMRDHLLHQTNNQIHWEVTNDLMRHCSMIRPCESWGVLSLWSQMCATCSQTPTAYVSKWQLADGYLNIYLLSTQFMRPLCVMKPVWSNIDGGSDTEMPSFSSAAILKRRRRQQSTMTLRLRRQSRTEPRPEQNTVKIMTQGRARLKDYWYVLCVMCVCVCVMCLVSLSLTFNISINTVQRSHYYSPLRPSYL